MTPLPRESNVGAERFNRVVAVRMGMSVVDAELLADLLPRLPADVKDQVLDQLWLKSVLTEQRRRTRIVERPQFERRADRILAALDPQEPAT